MNLCRFGTGQGMIMSSAAPLYLYAVAVGFAAAGVTGSIWQMVTGQRPRLILDQEPNLFTPLCAMATVINAPIAIFVSGVWRAFANPGLGLLLIAASLGWSFMQGVFILTQIFSLQ
jgi:hypothetical protein